MEPAPDFLENCLTLLENRANDQSVPVQSAMTEINNLQRFLVPKNLSFFIDSLPKIIETLLLCVDDRDVSLRHTASVILNSSVQIVLPFKKAAVLQFISGHCRCEFKPHALVAMVELSVRVSLFLTRKVASELFAELEPLFINIARCPSEISCEGFYKLIQQVRDMLQDSKVRKNVIEELLKEKSSPLGTDWDIKSAAILAYPDLVDETLDKLTENKLKFCAALPVVYTPEIPEGTPFEILLPFVRENPTKFFDRLQQPPTDPKQMAPYLFCLKSALEFGFKPEFDLSVLTNLSIEPNISQLQMECICLGKLSGTIDCDLSKVFTQCNGPSITALSICFNRFPLTYFLDEVLRINNVKPVIAKAVVIFLTEVDFSLYPMHISKAVDVIANISKSNFEIVQNILCERCHLFNCGKTEHLFMRLLESADYFDPVSFKNTSTLLSYISSPRVDDYSNIFFASLTEMDSSIIWGDANSLESFLSALRRFCMRSRRIRIPQFVAMLPQLVLYTIINLICSEIPQGKHMVPLEQSFSCPSGQALLNVLAKQPLISLLQLRDKAASAAAALKMQVVVDQKALDAIGKKLIPWPSANIWFLLSSSAKVFAETTAGLLSTDNMIVYAAAQLFPSKMHEVDDTSSPDLIAIALERGDEIEFTMSVPLVKAADRRQNFPTAIAEKLKNSWMTVAVKKHVELEAFTEFSKKPFSQWEGPPAFWELVPSFIRRLKSRGKMPEIDLENCKPIHRYIINRNPKIFNTNKVEICNIKHEFVKKKEMDMEFSLDEEPFDVAPEIIRELRIQLYERAGVKSLHDLVKCKPVKVYKEMPNIIHKALLNCESDCIADLCFFTIELAIAAENSDVSKQDANQILKYCPFRSYLVDLINKPWAPHRVPQAELANGLVFTETELLAIAKYQLIDGKKSAAGTPAIPISPTSLCEIVKLAGKQFYVCMLYDVVPPYSKENEKGLVSFVQKYGVSKSTIRILDIWLKKNEPLTVLREILSSSFCKGTYYPVSLINAIKGIAKKENAIGLTVQAHIMASDDTPLRKVAEKILPK